MQEQVTATLTNVLGQEVSSKKYSQLENAIYHITGPAGIYFLEIEDNNQQKQAYKIIKN